MVLMTLRQAITMKVQNEPAEELMEILKESVDGEEKVLPGLGVMFEMIWKNSDENLKQKMVNVLHSTLHQNEPQIGGA